MQLADMEFSRPLTHDLLVAVLNGLGGNLRKVIITRVEKNTYDAELIIHRNGEVISVDARPSDSIAVALRVDAKIFAQDDLLERASIEISEEDATSSPAEVITIYYDSHANLVARGVIRERIPVAPRPFPGFVPDPQS